MTLTNNVCADTAYMNELATEWELCDDCYPALLLASSTPPLPPLAVPPPHAEAAAANARALFAPRQVAGGEEDRVSGPLFPLSAYALAMLGIGGACD